MASKRGQPAGPANINWKHGAYSDYMSAEDADWITRKRAEYMAVYPHLHQPAMMDMLENYLKILMQIDRFWIHVMSPDYPVSETGPSLKRVVALSRSLSLLGARMGMTYTSQRRQSEKPLDDMTVMKPEDIVEKITRGANFE